MGQAKRGRARPPGSYIAWPRVVVNHADYRGLSNSAKVILMALAEQYRGNNNGDLSAAPKQMKEWGVASKVTVGKAVDELLNARLIVRTREGRFLNPGGQCALYALAWLPIDDCNGKHDLKATITPPRKFTLE